MVHRWCIWKWKVAIVLNHGSHVVFLKKSHTFNVVTNVSKHWKYPQIVRMYVYVGWGWGLTRVGVWFRILVNTLKPRQNGRHIAEHILKWSFLHRNCILFQISLKFVCKDIIYNNSTLVHIIVWHRPGDKTHVCVTRPQWVKTVIITFHDTCKYWLKQVYYWRI